MPRQGLKVQINVPAAQLKAVTNGLRQIDKKLPGELRFLLRRVARPVMREQRKLLRNMPTKRGGRTSRDARRKMARGVHFKLRTTRWPIMRIQTRAPFPDENNQGGMLPRGFDTFFTGFDTIWGHQQMSGQSWFIGPPAREQDDLEKDIKKLLNMTADDIRKAARAARSKRTLTL